MRTSHSTTDLVGLKKNGISGSKHSRSSSGLVGLNGAPSAAASAADSTSKLQSYAQFLKVLTKKRKNNQLTNADAYKKKFKKAQFKDFIDFSSMRVVDDRLRQLRFRGCLVTFNASVIGSRTDSATGGQIFLIEWLPKNM